MKQIKDYTEDEVRTAYEGIKTGLVLNANQVAVVKALIDALEEVNARAKELGISLK